MPAYVPSLGDLLAALPAVGSCSSTRLRAPLRNSEDPPKYSFLEILHVQQVPRYTMCLWLAPLASPQDR